MPKMPCLWHKGRQDPGEPPAVHNAAGTANSRAYPSSAALGIPPEAPARGLADLGESPRAHLLPQPHRVTLATRSWGDTRSRVEDSELSDTAPASPVFWDDSLVLLTGAGRTLEHTQPRRQGEAASGSNYPSTLVSVTHSFCKEPFPVSAISLS